MKKILFLLIVINIAVFVFSQEIEAKFVSRIKVTEHDGVVCLTWKNPSNFVDVLEVYRSSSIINSEDVLSRAEKIAELYDGEEEYNDAPPVGQSYYAVIIRNSHNSFRNVIFISFRNYTFKPVVIEHQKTLAITSFRADAHDNHIQLHWSYDGTDNGKSVSIYRSLSPITGDYALAQAIKIANCSLDAQTLTDMPVSNINYYYAIFFSDESHHSYTPNVNITDGPVYISESSDIMAEFNIDNFIPLPLLTFKTDPITGKPIKKPFIYKAPIPMAYSDKTAAAHNVMLAENDDVQAYLNQKNHGAGDKLDFTMLEDEDSYTPQEFDLEYKLLQSLLREKDYLNALFTLENLLCEPLSVSMRDRVSYYAGVIYYLQGDYRKAYIYLVLPLESYPKETSVYLTSIHTILYNTQKD
ncbi:MAG: hypothetical protein IKQ61_12560 [Spirochaetales bacterium]|nr:hypothetical protein [Spirochaetales bacterium]